MERYTIADLVGNFAVEQLEIEDERRGPYAGSGMPADAELELMARPADAPLTAAEEAQMEAAHLRAQADRLAAEADREAHLPMLRRGGAITARAAASDGGRHVIVQLPDLSKWPDALVIALTEAADAEGWGEVLDAASYEVLRRLNRMQRSAGAA